jgi:pimeloyl-ACP methyl ester carboxylesterase
MTAFHFGSRERRLFGYYEPAPANFSKVQAALLCHPLGNEQVFAYRTMRQLAARLVRTGFHVLRFDYFGTGDSYGDNCEGDLASWCDDVGTAVTELKEITGADTVDVVGLRLGANLSAQVASHRPGEIKRLVLWEPLAADELVAATREYLSPEGNGNSGLVGPDIVKDFARSAIAGKALPSSTLLLLTEGPPSAMESSSLSAEYVADAPAWIEDRLTTGSIPAEVLQRIVDWLQ